MKKLFLPTLVLGVGLLIVTQTSAQSSIDPPELKEAKKAYSQKSYTQALKLFQAYADKNPNDGSPYLYMGYIHESKKDFPKSIQMFRKAVEGNLSKSQKSTSLLKLALYYNYYQEWDQAAVYSSRYLKVNPNNKEVQKIYERADANRGRTPTRVSSNNNYISTAPSNDPPPVKKTKTEYEAILKQTPSDEEARWELSLIYFNEKDFVRAESIMKPLVASFPKKPSYSYKLGVTNIRLGKFNEALELFNLSKKHVDREDKQFLYYLYLNEGMASHKLDRYAEAEAAYLNSYKMNGKSSPLIALTKLYYDMSKYESCITSADRVLKTMPNQLETMMYKSLCKFDSTAKDAGSLYAFETELRKKYPKSENIPDTYYPAMIKLARDYTNQEKYKQAEDYFKVLESSYSQDREYLFYRGKALYYTGNPKKAIQMLSLVENSSAAMYLTAKSYAMLNDRLKTQELLKKAGDLKDIYWGLANEEDDFIEMRKIPEFIEFLNKKGADSEKTPASSN
ncbi:tetratricopeptide repeat protein [Leptospira sp. GIMC2001]|uniref:tetratricopeptide repeat protein n=1 Tax=Leptospira sp. GIMC2001 TaxID=1513297 RepID=UPI00234A8492|nr:tetratricopeptide repeat protein [Leptospira sp. GIMC2001]WCL49413.1 tetratricopeptide repeat protein [Leptospira sp. GIMC2001]